MTLAEVIDTLQTWIRNADDEYDREEVGRVAGLKEALYEIKRIEPCEDAISRAEVLKKAVYSETEEGWSGYTVDVEDIKDMPSVQPQPKTGHWIVGDGNREVYAMEYECSECGCNVIGGGDFCKWCGARMFEPQERED